MTQLLLDLKADAETVIAALASSILQPEVGNTEEKLDVIRTHCGPVVHQIGECSKGGKQIGWVGGGKGITGCLLGTHDLTQHLHKP